jgi:Mor family transcriptional regulator
MEVRMNKSVLRYAAYAHKTYVLEPFDVIMDLHGFDALCTLSDTLGGRSVYIPSLRTMFMGCLEMEMRREYSGANIKELARKYEMSERHIRRVLGSH